MTTRTKTLFKSELIPWLKSMAGAVILSISIGGQAITVESNITSPVQLATTIAQSHEWLADGPYVVAFDESDKSNDDEVPYTSIAIAFTSQASFTRTGESPIGGYRHLIESISDYEYVAQLTKGSFGSTGRVSIVLPSEPSELSRLKDILAKYSVAYVFPDETGTINHNNLKFGNGFYYS